MTEYTNPAIPSSWDWFSIDVSATLDSWGKIEAAEMYVRKRNNRERVDLDMAHLQVDYTAAAAGQPTVLRFQNIYGMRTFGGW